MTLRDRITEDMKTAMRAKDAERLGTIRFLLAAIKQREVDERIVLDDVQVVGVLDKLVKQRKDSITAFAQAGRTDLVDTLHREVWGQGFAPPTFSEEVDVVSQRLVGEKHLALKLKHQGQPVDGIWFGHTDPLPARVKLASRLDADEWQGVRRVRFLVEGAEF